MNLNAQEGMRRLQTVDEIKETCVAIIGYDVGLPSVLTPKAGPNVIYICVIRMYTM